MFRGPARRSRFRRRAAVVTPGLDSGADVGVERADRAMGAAARASWWSVRRISARPGGPGQFSQDELGGVKCRTNRGSAVTSA